MKSKALGTPDPTKQISRMWDQLNCMEKGQPASRLIAKIRQIVKDAPAAMPQDWRAAPSAMIALIDSVSEKGSRAYLLADMDMTRRELGYSDASALEQILIDAILLARLRLVAVEHGYAINTNKPGAADYWETLLTNAQNRLLRAVESLARVRRLARHTPAIQVNVAATGGQQVNCAGMEQFPTP